MKKTTKNVWMAMAIIEFTFNLSAAEPQSARRDFKQAMTYRKAFELREMRL